VQHWQSQRVHFVPAKPKRGGAPESKTQFIRNTALIGHKLVATVPALDPRCSRQSPLHRLRPKWVFQRRNSHPRQNRLGCSYIHKWHRHHENALLILMTNSRARKQRCYSARNEKYSGGYPLLDFLTASTRHCSGHRSFHRISENAALLQVSDKVSARMANLQGTGHFTRRRRQTQPILYSC
jgi:hypothetical protein